MRIMLLLTSEGIRLVFFCPKKQMTVTYYFTMVLILKLMLLVKQSDGQKSDIVANECFFQMLYII